MLGTEAAAESAAAAAAAAAPHGLGRGKHLTEPAWMHQQH
jgi:hypothetical protein